jgi:hypothetical protein
MIENIHAAEDPAWRDVLEQQVTARLGRVFDRNDKPLEAMRGCGEVLRATPRALHPCATEVRRPVEWRAHPAAPGARSLPARCIRLSTAAQRTGGNRSRHGRRSTARACRQVRWQNVFDQPRGNAEIRETQCL